MSRIKAKIDSGELLKPLYTEEELKMANAYYEAMLKARATLGSMNEGAPKWYAKELYSKGYRKASDVAREIFEEIERVIKNHGITYTQHKIAELKKKYTEEGK